jgi:hypothetical protein
MNPSVPKCHPPGTERACRWPMPRVIAAGLVLWLVTWLCPLALPAQPPVLAIETIPGMPPVVDPRNLYSETQGG